MSVCLSLVSGLCKCPKTGAINHKTLSIWTMIDHSTFGASRQGERGGVMRKLSSPKSMSPRQSTTQPSKCSSCSVFASCPLSKLFMSVAWMTRAFVYCSACAGCFFFFNWGGQEMGEKSIGFSVELLINHRWTLFQSFWYPTDAINYP